MNKSVFQAYSDYLFNVSNMTYDATMNYVKTTHEFVTEAVKLNLYKDVFGIMDTFVEKAAAKKSK